MVSANGEPETSRNRPTINDSHYVSRRTQPKGRRRRTQPITGGCLEWFGALDHSDLGFVSASGPVGLQARRDFVLRASCFEFAGPRGGLGGGYLGVASGSPPSTGMVAPVVGVWRVAKNSTAFATCVAVILALRRFRLR